MDALKSVDSTLGTPDLEAQFFHSHPLLLTSLNESASPADSSLEGAGAAQCWGLTLSHLRSGLLTSILAPLCTLNPHPPMQT